MSSVEMQDRVDRFDTFYRDYYEDAIAELAQRYPAESRSLFIDWTDLFRFDEDLAEDVLSHPDRLVREAEEALRLFDLPVDVSLGQAHVRFHGLPETTAIRDIRASHVNQLVSIRGIVRKSTGVKPRIEEAAFECQRCGTMSRIPQEGGSFQEPHQCAGCERKGPFRIDEAESEFLDAQKLRIQESPEGLRGGETPESIDVTIEDDITGEVSAGDSVRATGILRLEQQGTEQEKSTLFNVTMQGMSVVAEEEQFDEMDITEADEAEIIEMSSDPDIYQQMVDSIAPSIYGHEGAKLAMVLQLFSGVTKQLPDGSRTRGDMHLLLIGDPGTGKSQLLQYVRNIAPRSVYTSGKGSSAAGLTAAAVRDDFGDGQQWSLEAGALVLADRGIAAIDELDKMRCVTGDTLVHLSDGRISKIRDLAEEAAEHGEIEQLTNGRTIRNVDYSAWTMTGDGRIVSRPVSAIHEYTSPESLLEITLQSGETLQTTSDHPYITLANGTRVDTPADELEVGDWVYVPRSVPATAADGGAISVPTTQESPEGVSPAFGAVLGYVSGDGNIYHSPEVGSYGIRFTNSEEELLSHFETVSRRVFATEPTRPPSEQRADGVETVRVGGKSVAQRVLEAGCTLRTFDEKAFPDAVSMGGLATKAAFVRALADSDGCVDTSANNVCIYSSSAELLTGVKQCLLEFGIRSQMQTDRRPDPKRDLHVLAITDADSLQHYRAKIGFTLTRKSDALATVCEEVSGDRTILNVIPECGEVLHELRTELRLHQAECGLPAGTYCAFEQGTANLSLRCGKRVLQRFEERIAAAQTDLGLLHANASWEQLRALMDRYHVSQAELADDAPFSQPYISEHWGTDGSIKRAIAGSIERIIADVGSTDLSQFRTLVEGDVQWRTVTDIARVSPEPDDDRQAIIRHTLCTLLNCSENEAIERALNVVNTPPQIDTWADIRSESHRFGVGNTSLATELDVSTATLSRWVTQAVETDRFEAVRQTTIDRCESVRDDVTQLLDRHLQRNEAKVYDLTVDGTHNFIANGMVVHNSEDRSALHEGLEAQEISISKAGINATLKARCSLLGAANPAYGRFDMYEPMGEQIDLEPALISRFDLIFTITDQPNEEDDRRLADHILETNYAGQLHRRRTELTAPDVTVEEVEAASSTVTPPIEPELFRKYVAFAQQSCYPRLTPEARQAIEDFYVDLRSRGVDDDAPVPVTARKLEALVRLSEASARVRLSDTVELEDAERVIEIVRSCLQDIGVDPETGQYDADVIETGRSKTQRDRVKSIKDIIRALQDSHEEGAPREDVLAEAESAGIDRDKAEHQIKKLRDQGEVYSPSGEHLRVV